MASAMPTTVSMPEVENLAEQIGELVYAWGFKRIHGRIWTYLALSKQPLDAADLVRLMKISKALVSISLRELLDFEVLFQDGKSARGTQLYRVNNDMAAILRAVLRVREKRLVAHVQAAQSSLKSVPTSEREANGLCPEKLQQLERLLQTVTTNIDMIMQGGEIELAELNALGAAKSAAFSS